MERLAAASHVLLLEGQVSQRPVRQNLRKARHACWRRICSWIAHPLRYWYRRDGRAYTLLLRKFMPGFAVNSLRTAAKELHLKFQKLKPAMPSGTCVACGLVFQGLSIFVGDAAQMYEEIPEQVATHRPMGWWTPLNNRPAAAESSCCEAENCMAGCASRIMASHRKVQP